MCSLSTRYGTLDERSFELRSEDDVIIVSFTCESSEKKAITWRGSFQSLDMSQSCE